MKNKPQRHKETNAFRVSNLEINTNIMNETAFSLKREI